MAGEEDESWAERLSRQVREAKVSMYRCVLWCAFRAHLDCQDLPSYLLNFARRFLTGSYASVSSSASTSSDFSSSTLYRDTFGFRKVIVAATPRGIIYGLNSADGSVLWSRILGLGWAAEAGARHVPVKMFPKGAVKDGEKPRVVIVTQRLAHNVRVTRFSLYVMYVNMHKGLIDAVVFEIDAITGADALGKSLDADVLQGTDVVQGELVEAFMLPDEHKTIALIDKHMQVCISSAHYDRFRDINIVSV